MGETVIFTHTRSRDFGERFKTMI